MIGPVVDLREKIAWLEQRPLFAARIALTRPLDQSEELARLLRREGADVVITPTISIRRRSVTPDVARVYACCRSLIGWC